MRGGGRVCHRTTLALASLYACVALTASNDYGVPIEIKLWDTGRTPLAHMVDVTNGFGLRVLAEHNFLNDNNIAFSPYGLMGIMVALYEGVDGESSYQIQRGMQLPWNRNVMRIGFRDIHRTLKTYFVPEEGFLAGLALNNENVTFNDSYKKILRFYGFDLENDQIPTLAPTNSTNNATSTESTSTTTASGTSTAMPSPTNTENLADTSTPPTREETTPNPNAETIPPVDTRTSTTTPSPSSAPNSEQTTSNDLSSLSETETSTTLSSSSPTTEVTYTLTSETISTTSITTTETPAVETTTQVMSTTTAQPSTPESTTQTTTMMPIMETDAESISQQTSQATSALPDDPTTNEVASSNMEIGSMGSETTSSESTTTSMNTMTESDMTTLTTDSSTTEASSTADDATTTVFTTMTTESSLETLQRRKKSIVDFIFRNPPYIDDYFIYRSYHIGPEEPTPGYDDKMFLANGLKNIQVTYMHYDTVLEHAYLPHLEASALRLPLDSERYYLLVVLPDRGGAPEIGRLLGRMARESDLADVYAALRPRRVRAIVPSFMVKGHVTLTTDLQKLGIRDVFEPRQRDFTLMTHQAGVYVRSIEQAVSVAIRKYKPDDPKKNRYVANRVPVKFYATYPFLYFVMDSSIHVALMAGKMVDPLNSRIL